MYRPPPPELYLHIWPFKLIAKGKDTIRMLRWPVTFVLIAIGVCLLIAAVRYGLKPYALHIVDTADNVVFRANVLHVIGEYFLIL